MEDFLSVVNDRRASLADRIERQSLSVVAIHKVNFSSEEIEGRLRSEEGWSSLDIGYLQEITENLYLIDVSASDLGVIDCQLLEVNQDNDADQAPFAERYFDVSGNNLLEFEEEFSASPPEHFDEPGRVRFFMHYFDPDQQLMFGDIVLKLPPPTPLPQWLADVMPYRPPN